MKAPLLLSLPLLRGTSSYAPLSDSTLRALGRPTTDFDLPSGPVLAPLLRPRVPGTEDHAQVQAHITSFFATQLPRWKVIMQNSTSRTPATGDREVPFSNLILRRDPPGVAEGNVSRLTLAAHYDTLPTLEGFVGATDSAAPCAILMHVAAAVEAGLDRKWRREPASSSREEAPKGVQILLLDGEEPFVDFSSPGDGLYGSRSLAEEWASQQYPPHSIFKTPLEAISLFVLLDVLGAPGLRVPSYYPSTHWAYRHMARVEGRMRDLGLLESSPPRGVLLTDHDPPAESRSPVDDHLPFVERGLDAVLHLVPRPAPAVWHTLEDDGEHLDLGTVRDLARIVAGFVAEWMELDGFMDPDREDAEL